MADIVVTTGGNSVTNGTNFQTALNAASPGDRVILTAGATYDGTFTLADKGASLGNEITITTDAVGNLPEGRVSPSDASNMAKVRALTGSAFTAAANADWWIVDGLEITDNAAASALISQVFDYSVSSVHDMVVKRCYIHNKETGTDYERSIRFGIQFEGSGLTVQWNHIDILGYYNSAMGFGTFAPIDTMAILSVTGNTITVTDNYLSTWYNIVFTGGGDTAPQNTATITSSSTTTGTFSNVTGLTAGVVLRLDFEGAGTFTSAGPVTVTRTSGATLTTADIGQFGRLTQSGGSTTGVYEVTGVSGAVYTLSLIAGGHPPNGAVDFVFYETAMVDSVAGSVVNYTPYGIQALVQAPSKASWNYGDQGLVYDVTIQRNTFYIDPDFGQDVLDNNGNHPKGFFEIKNSKRMTVDGNYFLGFTAPVAWTASSQYGTAPWITTSETIFSNNWFEPEQHAIGKEAIVYSNNDYLKTTTPSSGVEISNNFFTHIRNLLSSGGISEISISHNTVINDSSGSGGYNSAVESNGENSAFSFTDNIVDYRGNGIQCLLDPFTLGTCYPSGAFLNNVVIDTQAQGFSTSVWGSGSALSPIPTTFGAVGFVNANIDNYQLEITSAYKGAASDMTDPGVDWDALLSALNSTPTRRVGSMMAIFQ